MPEICTVTVNAQGGRCGQPAVFSFGSRREFGECAQHYIPLAGDEHPRATGGVRVGDHVPVSRHGRTYDAVVTHVGARGAAYATFTYLNGSRRTVRVSS